MFTMVILRIKVRRGVSHEFALHIERHSFHHRSITAAARRHVFYSVNKLDSPRLAAGSLRYGGFQRGSMRMLPLWSILRTCLQNRNSYGKYPVACHGVFYFFFFSR